MSDWAFEIEYGDALANTIGWGLADGVPPPDDNPQVPPVVDFEDVFASPKSALADDFAFFHDHDTTEEPPPPEPPTPPAEPGPPTGVLFDYSSMIPDNGPVRWDEWGAGYNQSSFWGGDYDSLEEYMHGQWYFDLDPELIDFDGAPGDRYTAGGYQNVNQYGVASVMGLQGSGGLVPLYRQWTETTTVPRDPSDPNSVDGIRVTVHRELGGWAEIRSFEVASLQEGLVGLVGRLWPPFETAWSLNSIANLYSDMQDALGGEPNSSAISGAYRSTTDGGLYAPVTLNGTFIGHVRISADGQSFSLLDVNNNLIRYETPLASQWGSIQAARYNEQIAHQERVMGVPFARFLVELAGTGFTAGYSFLVGEGLQRAASVVTGSSWQNATVEARLLEAAYELRIRQLQGNTPP